MPPPGAKPLILSGNNVDKIQRAWRAGKKKVELNKQVFTLQRHANKNYLLVKPVKGKMPIAVIEISRYSGMSEEVKRNM